jgi:hypothetical protein
MPLTLKLLRKVLSKTLSRENVLWMKKNWEAKKEKMKMEEKEIGKSSARTQTSSMVSLAILFLLLTAFAALAVVPVIASAAQGVEARVNAPAYVEGTFNATIDVDNVTDLNSGQLDLSFNSSVVNVTDVKEGEIDGVVVPIFIRNT